MVRIYYTVAHISQVMLNPQPRVRLGDGLYTAWNVDLVSYKDKDTPLSPYGTDVERLAMRAVYNWMVDNAYYSNRQSQLGVASAIAERWPETQFVSRTNWQYDLTQKSLPLKQAGRKDLNYDVFINRFTMAILIRHSY